MSGEGSLNRRLPTVTVGGFATVALTRRELASIMVSDCMRARQSRDDWIPKLVFSSNGQGIALAGRDSRYYEAMRSADIIHADGMSAVFASRLTQTPLPERICTTDFFVDAAQAASEYKLKFFLLGAHDEQNEAAAEGIRQLYPGVELVGRHHGYFGDDEDEAVCQLIKSTGADVLWVALGRPRQEFWSVRNRHRLTGVGWVKTCGGLFSYLAGDAPRAPQWVRDVGLEWLYRLADDPKRLAGRYLATNPYALYRLLRYIDRGEQ